MSRKLSDAFAREKYLLLRGNFLLTIKGIYIDAEIKSLPEGISLRKFSSRAYELYTPSIREDSPPQGLLDNTLTMI